MNAIEPKSPWQETETAIVPAEPPIGVAQMLWRRKWTLILVLILCIGAGVGYLFLATPIYTSTGLLYVEHSAPPLTSDNERQVPANYAYTEAQVVQSLPVLSMALQQPGIKDLPTFQGQDDLMKTLQDMLDARVGEKDDIINLAVSTPYSEDSAKIAQAVVDSFLTYHATHRRTNASEMLKVLQKEKNAQEQKRGEWLRAMLKFKQENQALSFDLDKSNLAIERMSALSTALTTTQMDAIQAKADFDAACKAASDPSKLSHLMESQQVGGSRYPQDIEDSSIRNNLHQLQVQLAGLKQDVSDDSPAVRALQKKIEEVKSQVSDREKRFAESYVVSMTQRKEAAEQRLVKLQEAYDQQHKVAQSSTVKGAEYAVLDAELKRTERSCDLLDTRIKEINVSGDAGATNIAVLQSPEVPTLPSKPKKNIVLAGAGLIGLLLGFGWVIVRERNDVRLRTGAQIALIVSAPVLGTVPRMRRSRSIVKSGQYVLTHTGSAIAEAYRTIRTNIFSRSPKGQGVVLQITSPCANEGKTTLTSNLGIAMAQSGQKTLVLDADLRNPSQHKIFSLPEDGGLRDVLSGKASLLHCVKSTTIGNLDILSCGTDGANLGELLTGPAFRELLRELSQKYRYILVDSPPVTQQADSRILAANCDATVLVLRADQSERTATQQARNGIVDAGGKVLGVVVNATSGRSGQYAYPGYPRGDSLKVEMVATEKMATNAV